MAAVQFNLWTVILAFGALQGYLLAVILYRHPRGVRVANCLLSGLLLVISIQLTDACLTISGLLWKWPHLINVTRPLWFVIAPLLYLYVRQLIKPAIGVGKKDLLHLLPMLLSFLGLLQFYSLAAPEKLASVRALYQLTQPTEMMLFFWNLYTIQLLVYVWMSRKLVSQRQQLTTERSAGYPNSDYGWLQKLLWIFVAYLVFAFLTISVLTIANTYLGTIDYISIFILTIFIHTIAIMAIIEPENMFPMLERLRKKYRNSALTRADRERVVKQLMSLMKDQQPYLERDLKLKDLAACLNLPPHHLSQILNQQLASNFYDFVNDYRIKEAKARLIDPTRQHLTIEAIATDVGFKSRASFYRIFKKATGKTPTEFIHGQRKKTAI